MREAEKFPKLPDKPDMEGFGQPKTTSKIKNTKQGEEIKVQNTFELLANSNTMDEDMDTKPTEDQRVSDAINTKGKTVSSPVIRERRRKVPPIVIQGRSVNQAIMDKMVQNRLYNIEQKKKQAKNKGERFVPAQAPINTAWNNPLPGTGISGSTVQTMANTPRQTEAREGEVHSSRRRRQEIRATHGSPPIPSQVNSGVSHELGEKSNEFETVMNRIDFEGPTSDSTYKRASTRLTHVTYRIRRIVLNPAETNFDTVSKFKNESFATALQLDSENHESVHEPDNLSPLHNYGINVTLATGYVSPSVHPVSKSIPVYKLGITFDGNPKNVLSFIEKVEEVAKVRHISEVDLFEYSSDLFDEKATSWLRQTLSIQYSPDFYALVDAWYAKIPSHNSCHIIKNKAFSKYISPFRRRAV
ncbi:hypothetical protein JTB14_009327 [Gonioctena quinquepunctata]|nr:hypothetical protein JTB14_009327 [Gonioctena quinquepunctata]